MTIYHPIYCPHYRCRVNPDLSPSSLNIDGSPNRNRTSISIGGPQTVREKYKHLAGYRLGNKHIKAMKFALRKGSVCPSVCMWQRRRVHTITGRIERSVGVWGALWEDGSRYWGLEGW